MNDEREARDTDTQTQSHQHKGKWEKAFHIRFGCVRVTLRGEYCRRCSVWVTVYPASNVTRVERLFRNDLENALWKSWKNCLHPCCIGFCWGRELSRRVLSDHVGFPTKQWKWTMCDAISMVN